MKLFDFLGYQMRIINNAKHGNEMDAWENIFFSPVSAMQLVIIIEYLLEKNIIGIFNVGSVDCCNKFDFVYNVCAKIGLKGIVVKANQNIFLERKRCISYANKNKMFITAK